MAKVKPAAHGVSKNIQKNLKNGAINKKKHQKFKQTPQGKVALINGSQVHSNGNSKNQKNGVNLQMQKKSPKGGNRQSASPKKSPSVKVAPKEEKDDTDSSDEDINEGISIKEEVSAPEDEIDDDDSSEESSSEETVTTILGKSLADETDEDDEEFDADSDAEDAVENKGVKMFKGLKQEVKGKASKQEPSSEDDDDDEDDEESEEDEENDKATPDLAALLGESIADESDDEEFEAAEDDSDDDDEVSDSDEEDVEADQSVTSAAAESSDEDDDEDDDDDDEGEDSSPDITVLLGKSIADDEDDASFVAEEDSEDDDEAMSEDEDDEDAAAELSSSSKDAVKGEKGDKKDAAKKNPKLTKEEKEERDKRTIFIGNVPKETDRSALKKAFRKFGIIESLRMRGIVSENPKLPLKVAAILKKHHPKIKVVCYFITFKEEDSAKKALSMNGKKWDGNILRVDICNQTQKPDQAKAVFLGNLPFSKYLHFSIYYN